MSGSVIRRRVIVHGRVQGVFFRASVQEQAQAAGAAGSARNREDGAVEVILEGAPEAVERVVAFCRHGPDQARVQDVDVVEEEPRGLSSFQVN